VGDHPDTEWDAGDLSCGDLVLHLRFRMMAMAPGTVLRLVATDPGAPADIPAWCRLTGHTLIDTHPPVYLIRRKES
jgi:tRNA 2-thiouridine synthesizing protein A